MPRNEQNENTSICLASMEKKEIQELVTLGYYTHYSDAMRAIFRRGLQEIKKEKGLCQTGKPQIKA